MDKKMKEAVEKCINDFIDDLHVDAPDGFPDECESCDLIEAFDACENRIRGYRTTIETLSLIIADLRAKLDMIGEFEGA